MAKPKVTAGGGLAALLYVFRKARESGGLLTLYRRLRARNTCKTCALGMGGQKGGMVNEKGHFPEVCKKSVQAQAGDMGKTISEDFFKNTPLSQLQNFSSRQWEELGRLPFPIMIQENDSHFKRISWDEVFDKCKEGFQRATPDEIFFYASGRSSNEAAFLMQIVARAFGTTNIHNCSYYCHQASGVALAKVYGSGTASIVLDDLEKTDLAVIVGANPASNHPRLITQLIKLRRRGGKVIIINPLKELGLVRFRVPSDIRSFLFGSKISDLYLQPHIGTDIALFNALLKGLIENGWFRHDFIQNFTKGWEELKRNLDQQNIDDLLNLCGVPKEAWYQALRYIGQSRRGIFCWAMGLTQHVHGVDNILALANLALARGWLGKPGAGLLPIRGHSNVQGVGSCGVTPGLKKAFKEKMEELYHIQIPEKAGKDTYHSMVAAQEGKIKAAFFLGGNLYASNPDLKWASEALQRIPFCLNVTTKMNDGHVWGRGKTSIIVPALARDEEHQSTTQESMFNFVRISEGGTPNIEGEMRSEVDIIATLAETILPPNGFDWHSLRSHQMLREEIAKVVPGYQKIDGINQHKEEFQIEGRTFHAPSFSTEDGKAHFHIPSLPKFSLKEGEFRLMTIRSEGQFNTVVYEEEDLYRGNSRRDVVMMSKEDAENLNLKEGDSVHIETTCGKMQVRIAISEIAQGNLAMYYPEANRIVPRQIDSRSKTPAFKSVAARLIPLHL